MKEISLFDILGPVMIGPSSSHTAGALRLGNIAAMIYQEEAHQVDFYLHGSFAKTYRGHGTDLALVAGVLGLTTYDERIVGAFSLAEQAGIAFDFHEKDLGYVHPNTVKIVFDQSFSVTGSSLGGGRVEIIEINGTEVSLQGDYPTLVLQYEDQLGMIQKISALMAGTGVNIATMKVTRQRRLATMVLELDGKMDLSTFKSLESLDFYYLASVGAVEEK
ncbi:MAG: L-serine ammonia-lyase, iron-sulfur-dependent, subunit beta [Tissierellia bacterium]|nr:L-serine ammonia-lyase, iron-sulfur-dependent, subunit beta [Tissierellia bacterium]